MSKLATIMQQDLSYNEEGKRAFHREAKKVLKQVATHLGLTAKDYSLRSNMGGIAVSGEVTLHTDKLYIQIDQSCMGPRSYVLFRTCNGRKDYSGGSNNFTSVDSLESPEFIDRLTQLAA